MKLTTMEIVHLAELRLDNVQIERRNLKKAKRELEIHKARVILAREEVKKANEVLIGAKDILFQAEMWIADNAPCPWKKKVK